MIEHQRLNPQDINQICHLHKTLFSYFRSSSFIKRNNLSVDDHLNTINLSYQTSSELLKSLAFDSDGSLDNETFSLHSIITNETLNKLYLVEKN